MKITIYHKFQQRFISNNNNAVLPLYLNKVAQKGEEKNQTTPQDQKAIYKSLKICYNLKNKSL